MAWEGLPKDIREEGWAEVADPRRPRLSAQEWKPMSLDPECKSSRERVEAGRGLGFLLQNSSDKNNSDNSVGSLQSWAGL